MQEIQKHEIKLNVKTVGSAGGIAQVQYLHHLLHAVFSKMFGLVTGEGSCKDKALMI